MRLLQNCLDRYLIQLTERKRDSRRERERGSKSREGRRSNLSKSVNPHRAHIVANEL